MQLYVVINSAQITTLVDSRSTHSFMDLDTVECIGLKFCGRAGLRVTI
jgi:hypothetical protein